MVLISRHCKLSGYFVLLCPCAYFVCSPVSCSCFDLGIRLRLDPLSLVRDGILCDMVSGCAIVILLISWLRCQKWHVYMLGPLILCKEPGVCGVTHWHVWTSCFLTAGHAVWFWLNWIIVLRLQNGALLFLLNSAPVPFLKEKFPSPSNCKPLGRILLLLSCSFSLRSSISAIRNVMRLNKVNIVYKVPYMLRQTMENDSSYKWLIAVE